jgi:general L-amino acid transport system substrate-binding protein
MRSLKLAVVSLAAIALSGLAAGGAFAAGPTLTAVKKNGVVTCGVSTGLAGFSMPDKQGKYTGIDSDTCRQLAAAIFGDATKVKFAPLPPLEGTAASNSANVGIRQRAQMKSPRIYLTNG